MYIYYLYIHEEIGWSRVEVSRDHPISSGFLLSVAVRPWLEHLKDTQKEQENSSNLIRTIDHTYLM